MKLRTLKPNIQSQRGFTLIELLVVIAIIGLLASTVLASLNGARASARDAKRLSEIRQIMTSLEMYRNQYDKYPDNTDNDNSGWDTGCVDSADVFISPLVTGNFLSAKTCDPSIQTTNGGYAYYRYAAGSSKCPSARGAFYVLGIRDVEGSGRPHSNSPGWSCPERNWQGEFDWVTGSFEK